jgi:hypothetical protein
MIGGGKTEEASLHLSVDCLDGYWCNQLNAQKQTNKK